MFTDHFDNLTQGTPTGQNINSNEYMLLLPGPLWTTRALQSSLDDDGHVMNMYPITTTPSLEYIILLGWSPKTRD